MWSWTGPTPSYIGNVIHAWTLHRVWWTVYIGIYIEEQILSLYLGCNVKMCGKIIFSQSLELLLRWAIKNISIYDFWRVFFYFKWSYYKWDHIYITKIHSKLEIWYLFCSSLVYINNTNGVCPVEVTSSMLYVWTVKKYIPFSCTLAFRLSAKRIFKKSYFFKDIKQS